MNRPDDRGTVTAELAVVLPAVVLLAGLLAGAGRAALAQLDCVDAARSAARAAARGEGVERVRQEAVALAPPGAVVTTEALSAGLIRVHVAARVRLLGAADLAVGGDAVAHREGA